MRGYSVTMGWRMLGQRIQEQGAAEQGRPQVRYDLEQMHFLMFYDLAPDYLERRGEFRAAHLALAWEAHERGELVLGGALADPVDGSVVLFQGESPEVAERFARADPYVLHGLVTGWRVRPWTTVVGEGASTPVRPNP